MPVPPSLDCSWSVARLPGSRPPYQVMVFTAPRELCASPFANLGSGGSTARIFSSQTVLLLRPRRQARFPTAELRSSIPAMWRQRISRSGDPPFPSPLPRLFLKAISRAAPPRLPLARPAPPCSTACRLAGLPPPLPHDVCRTLRGILPSPILPSLTSEV